MMAYVRMYRGACVYACACALVGVGVGVHMRVHLGVLKIPPYY